MASIVTEESPSFLGIGAAPAPARIVRARDARIALSRNCGGARYRVVAAHRLPIGSRLVARRPIWTPIEFDLRGSTCDKRLTLDERFAALQPREGKMIGLVGLIALLLSAPKQFHP